MADAATHGSVFTDRAAVLAAHKHLLADKTIQFDLPFKQSPHYATPAWLKALFHMLGRAVRWVGSGWNWILIALGIVAIVILLLVFVPPLREWIAARLRGRGAVRDEAPEWTPDTAQARRLIEDAEALATAGRYDEAVHLILFRSIEDIERWRGTALRPSLTARDIAKLDTLSSRARGVFARIVGSVETSFFAGRELDRTDWESARADYAGFALEPA